MTWLEALLWNVVALEVVLVVAIVEYFAPELDAWAGATRERLEDFAVYRETGSWPERSGR